VQDPAYLQEIKARAERMGATMYLDADNAKKVELMQNAACVLVPSKMQEPFNLVTVEAMSCGSPVVALADGGIPEVVKEGGVVCADAEAMVDGVKYVLDHLHITPADCRWNAERFSRRNMALAYLEKYRNILSGNEW